ncbi:GPI alpha-mannosyltransferase III [Trypanosoma cruzi]|nr:GPI alpha-mannosyltransferase III [Trypanosoma cruzi]
MIQKENKMRNLGGGRGKNCYDDDLPHLPWYGILLIFLYRLLLSVSIQTAESPDEWWQSTEIAYYIVFGKGHLPWEWHMGLRSVVFPFILAIPFFLLKALGLDSTWAIWFAARLMQALVITTIDLFVFRLGRLLDVELGRTAKNALRGARMPKLFLDTPTKDPAGKVVSGRSVAYFALFLSLSNWYMSFTGVRTYSNVVEAMLVLMTIQETNYIRFLLFSGLACAFRVTSGVVLFPLVFLHLAWAVRERGVRRGLMRILLWGIVIFVLLVGGIVVSDSLFYDRWVVTPLAFLKFNVLQNASRFFGEHPWYFYLFPCLPALLGPHVLFTLAAPLVVWQEKVSKAVALQIFGLFFFILWPVACYSLIGHKENRFMTTVLPICFVVTAFVLARRYDRSRVIRRLHKAFFVFNVTVLILAGYVHRRGPLDVMLEVRNGPKMDRLDIVTRCYATPGYSFLHGKVNHLGLIDCPVYLNTETGLPKPTEDMMFRKYPKDYVLWKYDGIHTFNISNPDGKRSADELRQIVSPMSSPHPDVMVMYRDTANKIKHLFLEKHGYKLYRSFFHTPLLIEPGEDNYMEMWVRNVVQAN